VENSDFDTPDNPDPLAASSLHPLAMLKNIAV
jgi:hypothetical protein